MYNWVLHWAETPYAEWALFLLAFAESSVFPVPPDVLLIAMALSVKQRSFRYAAICTAGSALGGLLGYLIGWGAWAAVNPFFFRYVFSEATFHSVVAYYEQYNFWIVFIAAFTPIPYKVITISAGVCHISLIPFVIASFIGRGARFFLVAVMIYFFGQRLRNFIEKYFDLCTIAFTVLLIGGFVALKYLR